MVGSSAVADRSPRNGASRPALHIVEPDRSRQTTVEVAAAIRVKQFGGTSIDDRSWHDTLVVPSTEPAELLTAVAALWGGLDDAGAAGETRRVVIEISFDVQSAGGEPLE